MTGKRKVFVSFRFKDANKIKDNLVEFLEEKNLIIDKSEDIDRREMSEETIQKYLYDKLKDSSITIVLLTPNAVNYSRNQNNVVDDWLYDELRYSLYNRNGNPINGAIALYTPQVEKLIIQKNTHTCDKCNKVTNVNTILKFDNLVWDNMMNIKGKYKTNQCDNVYDSDNDSYISLIKLEDFYNSPEKYLEKAANKRRDFEKYTIHVTK